MNHVLKAFSFAIVVLVIERCSVHVSTWKPQPLNNQQIVLDGTVAGCSYFNISDPKKLHIFQSDGGPVAWMNINGTDEMVMLSSIKTIGNRTLSRYSGQGAEITIDTTSHKVCEECTWLRLVGKIVVQRGREMTKIDAEGACGS